MKKILIIQTAFIGDVILATAVIEKLHLHFPSARIDFLVRKGNESILEGHPFIHKLWIWDKKKRKFSSYLKLMISFRSEKYDLVVNLQRYFLTGLLTVLSGGRITSGFDKNPFSVFFSHVVPHRFGSPGFFIHEVERNLALISKWTDNQFTKPKIYLDDVDLPLKFPDEYITVSPASVWFTKQFPVEKWLAFIDRVGERYHVFLLGARSDMETCAKIQERSAHPNIHILAGQLTLRQSAAVMSGAKMNFVNDSAPLHLASAVNAPVTAVYCSTVPAFGFTPLSDCSFILETSEKLTCRPCNLHGKKACPKGHFKCSHIAVEELLAKLDDSPQL